MQPAEVHIRTRRRNRELIRRIVHFDQHLRAQSVGHDLQDGRNGGNRRFITGNEQPLGLRVQRVAASGTGDQHRLADLRLGGPGRGGSFAVQHEVHGQLAARGIEVPRRVGP